MLELIFLHLNVVGIFYAFANFEKWTVLFATIVEAAVLFSLSLKQAKKSDVGHFWQYGRLVANLNAILIAFLFGV